MHVSTTGTSSMSIPSSLPCPPSAHQQGCEVMEDVGQREEDSGLPVQLPLRALLLHQPPFLLGERKTMKVGGPE